MEIHGVIAVGSFWNAARRYRAARSRSA